MATAAKTVYLQKPIQEALIKHVNAILAVHKSKTEIRTKMETIDRAYARYIASASEGGVDTVAGNTACSAFDKDNIVAPIVVSQVDSMVAYLAEVFLSGAPLFPVVSTPKNRKWAEQLETLIDDHSVLGGYTRQLLIFLRDSVKYNIGAIECSWEQIDQFTVEGDFTSETGKKIDRKAKSFTAMRRLDMYNTIWDDTVAPGDVSLQGDYAGDIQILSRTKLKRLINKLASANEAYNASDALKENAYSSTGAAISNYYIHPTLNNYITPTRPDSKTDWYRYFGANRPAITGPNNFELITMYVRIIPSDFNMIVPQPNIPQIWKLRIINGAVIIGAKRIITAYDALPILFGQPLEDGMGYQTKSIAESVIPFQEAATTLFGIRFAAARRAVADRALYDPDMISPSDINSPVAAPKIPVRGSSMKEKSLEVAYKQIPFDMRGTETTLQDAAQLVSFSEKLSGLNGPRQGQFQRGNKSVSEWDDTMGGSDGRLRLSALTLAAQVFMLMKETIKLNIFQYGEDAVVVSQKNGEVHDIKLDELRKQVLSFKMADGYTPKSKVASMDMITTGMQMLMNSPILQQAYGNMLPAMWAHMMSLGGVKGLEEYAPEMATAGAVPANLATNTLAAPVADPASAPIVAQPPIV